MSAHVQLRFIRLNRWPLGTHYHVVSNALRASNGDLIPPADPEDPLDLDHLLTARPIEIWPIGKAGVGLDEVGARPVGWPSNSASGFGAGQGIVGLGEVGYYNDEIIWSTRGPSASPVIPAVRDGEYKFGVLF